jgi:hypothetical protein
MTKISTFAAAAFAAVVTMSSTAAIAQGTLEQRIACTPDVFRLCKAEIPNVSKIIDCMEKQKENLSPSCQKVFTPELLSSVKAAQAAPAATQASLKK